MKQAQATAVNVLGGDILLTAETPVTMLKGVGLELFTVGRIHMETGDEVIAVGHPELPSYRRLVLCEGRANGPTIRRLERVGLRRLGYPVTFAAMPSSAAR